jgi:hypothetical protein
MLASTRRTLEHDNPGLLRNGDLIDVTTSIDSLSPHSAFLPVLLEAQRSPQVRYHNIVGRVEDEGLFARFVGLDDPNGSDGVVPVSSAHLEYASSEIVVPADHSAVHRHPRSVLEVRRILLEHAAESDRYGPGPLAEPPWVAERTRAARFSGPDPASPGR